MSDPKLKRWHLIAYDISDDKRYREVHRLLKGYGQAVQYSIFRCHLSPRQLEALRLGLERHLDKATDRLLIVPLCERCRDHIIEEGPAPLFDEPERAFKIL